MDKKELIDKLVKDRTFQIKHGSVEQPECHRLPHEFIDQITHEYKGMSKHDIVQLAMFIDGDTRRQALECNKVHSNKEKDLKKSAAGSNVSVLASVASRANVQLDRVLAGYNTGQLSESNVSRLVTVIGKSLYQNVSVLDYYLSSNDKSLPRVFKNVLERECNKRSHLEMMARDAAKTSSGKVHGSSTLVSAGHLVYKSDGSVDRRCRAYKRHLVDETGKLLPFKTLPARVAPSKDRKSSGLTESGTPDKRTTVGKVKAARVSTGLTKSGTPDKRTTVGKALYAAAQTSSSSGYSTPSRPSSSYSYTSDRKSTGLTKSDTPDKRTTVGKALYAAAQTSSSTGSSYSSSSSYSSPSPSYSSSSSPSPSYSNSSYSSPSPSYSSSSSSSGSSSSSSSGSGSRYDSSSSNYARNNDGSPDMRFKCNRR